jgi:cytochrome c biogenesis protein
VKTQIERAEEVVADVLKGKYRNLQKKAGNTGTFYFAEKGRYTLFGVYLVHFSVLLILIGGIMGSLFGFEAFVNIPEGDGADKVMLRKNRIPKPLPFNVRCEKFTVEFYPNGTPKEYRSDLAFIRDGKVAFQGPLMVNHPITFEGITFYQSSYGSLAGNRVRLSVKKEGTGETVPWRPKSARPSLCPGRKGRRW